MLKKCKAIIVVLPIIAIILEILPSGVVTFADVAGRGSFSHFNIKPYGYPNYVSFATAILTCLLLAMAVFTTIRNEMWIKKCALTISLVTAIISLYPLIFGVQYTLVNIVSIDYFFHIDIGIAVCLIIETIILRRRLQLRDKVDHPAPDRGEG